jgi:hypothetical protein
MLGNAVEKAIVADVTKPAGYGGLGDDRPIELVGDEDVALRNPSTICDSLFALRSRAPASEMSGEQPQGGLPVEIVGIGYAERPIDKLVCTEHGLGRAGDGRLAHQLDWE